MRGFAVFGLTALLLNSAAWGSEVRSYSIDLRYEPGAGRITATANVALKPEPQAKSITFYLHDELQVSAVRLQGQPVAFHQRVVPYDYNYDTKASRIEVETGGRDVSGGLEIVYTGRFSPSKARSPSDYMRGDRDGLYLRSYAYSLWFPTFAESNANFPAVDFERVRITAPADFRAVFVGEEVSRTERNGLATGTWQARAVGPYDAQLTVRRFAVKRSGAVVAYFLKDSASEEGADRILEFADKLLAYYRSHYRENAAQRTIHMVEEPEFGDIASANVIGLRDANWRKLKDGGVELETMAHELVHAFVQTPTPKNDRLYAFGIEGFPSYFHWPALEAMQGEAFYQKKMDEVQQGYLTRRATGKGWRDMPLPPEKAVFAIAPDEIGTYKDMFVLNDRALLFWDYLRRNMPRERYDAMVHELMVAPRVTADDFFALIGRYAPALEEDAHIWLETTEFPEKFRRAVKS